MASNRTKRNVFRVLSVAELVSIVAQAVLLVAGGDVDGWLIVAQVLAAVLCCIMWRRYSAALRRDYFYGPVLRRSRTWEADDTSNR